MSNYKNDGKARLAARNQLEYKLDINVSYHIYKNYGEDKTAIKEDVYEYVQAASVIYEREMNIKLVVSSIIIWEKPEPFPYTTVRNMIEEVEKYWKANIKREGNVIVSFTNLVTTFQGKTGICTAPFFESSKFRWNYLSVLCHELGHTLGSPHTHNCNWQGGPIDACESVEGDCYKGELQEVNGTIMSYCETKQRTFHPQCRDLIRNFSEGKIDKSFFLESIDSSPLKPEFLEVEVGSPLLKPVLIWKYVKKASNYFVEVSDDETFSKIEYKYVTQFPIYRVNNTLLRKNYYFRVKALNEFGESAWSNVFKYNTPVYSIKEFSPTINDALDEKGNILLRLDLNEKVSKYSVEMTSDCFKNCYVNKQVVNANSTGLYNIKHSFIRTSLPKWANDPILIRVRAISESDTSKFSKIFKISQVYNNGFVPFNSSAYLREDWIEPIPSNLPIVIEPFGSDPTKIILEISKDSLFNQLTSRDSSFVNPIGDYFQGSVIFKPSFQEKTTYFVRTKGISTNYETLWNRMKLVSSIEDKRFTYYNPPANLLGNYNPQALTNFSMRGIVKNNELFLFTDQRGFYKTSDLSNWQSYNSKTMGANFINRIRSIAGNKFGIIYYISDNKLFKLEKGNISSYTMPGYSSGNFLEVDDNNNVYCNISLKGISKFDGKNWTYLPHPSLKDADVSSYILDNKNRLIVGFNGGAISIFENNAWTKTTYLPADSKKNNVNNSKILNLVVDNNGKLYACGLFGVAVYDEKNSTWEIIKSISEKLTFFYFDKVFFDSKNVMWILSRYPSSNTSLLKYDGVNTSLYPYSPILYESTDIVYFRGKIVLLTPRSGVYEFDENTSITKNLNSKCGDEEINIPLNAFLPSYYDKSQFKVDITPNDSTTFFMLPVKYKSIYEVSATIPENIQDGKYKARVSITDPWVYSKLSNEFVIAKQPKATIIADGPLVTYAPSTVKMAVIFDSTWDYQWFKDGKIISNATKFEYEAKESGTYYVQVTSAFGCVSKISAVNVNIQLPLSTAPQSLTTSESLSLQNIPNPAHDYTEIKFYLKNGSKVLLNLYDSNGRVISSIVNGQLSSGWHKQILNTQNLNTGTYICSLQTDFGISSLRILVSR